MTGANPSVDELLARCTFPAAGTSVDCAVSGGADSSALLVLAVAAGLRVTAHHVDHGLRPGSGAEADLVARLADRFGAAFVGHRVAVTPGADLEARARRARAAVLPPGVLTGHTADDQAETVLLQLLRGAGPAGAAAMAAERRPLLALRRAETDGLCRSLDLEVVEDPTNQDPRFRRNRVRHEVLPLLGDVADRDVVPLLVRFAALEAGLVEALDDLVGDVDAADVAALRALPPAARAHVLRRAWRQATGETYAPDAAAVERMLAVVDGEVPRAEVHGGWSLHRRSGRLRWCSGADRVDDR